MAVHKRLDMYTRVTRFQCDSCHKYIEEEERRFFSKTTRDNTEMLCPSCFGRAKTFQWVTGVFTAFVVAGLFFASLISLF